MSTRLVPLERKALDDRRQPGYSVHWTLETHEFVQIPAGRMTVTRDGGQPTEIGAGDVAVFPRGWAGPWQIHETIRKVYVIF